MYNIYNFVNYKKKARYICYEKKSGWSSIWERYKGENIKNSPFRFG